MGFEGLMMGTPLTLRMAYERARRVFPDVEVATKTAAGMARSTYGDVCDRAARLLPSRPPGTPDRRGRNTRTSCRRGCLPEWEASS